MMAFEVFVNGKKVCTAGVRKPDLMDAMLWLTAEPRELSFRLSGLIHQTDDSSEIVNWLKRSLEIGDELTIRVIESEIVDDPLPRRQILYSCSFCLRNTLEVEKFISGKGVRICNVCVTDFLKITENGGEQDTTDEVSAEDRCSFCAKPRVEVAAMFSGNDRRICDCCLARCQKGVFGDARRNGKVRPIHDDD